MAALPPSLLSRMYERASLRNTGSGFELTLKNRLAPSTIVAMGPLIVDGERYEPNTFRVSLERPAVGHGRPLDPIVRSGSEISSDKSLPFAVNSTANVSVQGKALGPGRHELVLSFTMREIGQITVVATDEVLNNSSVLPESR